MISHVEGHVAARMRRHNLKEGELVINRGVCGTNERDPEFPLSCDKILEDILPRRIPTDGVRDPGWRRDLE
ncbi:hypothetical protein Lfu02_00580 [Longispora fulva]|nr:hypothetical protein Lfu02_00580 [Longispora fulva]